MKIKEITSKLTAFIKQNNITGENLHKKTVDIQNKYMELVNQLTDELNNEDEI